MRRRSLLSLMLVVPLTLLSACGDEVTDPDGLLDAAETERVLRSAESLPLLPTFMDGVDDAGRFTFVRARELWDAGTASDDPRGASRRRLAVAYAAPVLARTVPAGEWTETRSRIEDWMGTVRPMLRHVTLPRVEDRLAAAAHELERAEAATSHERRVQHLLLAGSELVETTPRYVARTLAREADAALRRASAPDAPAIPKAALERAARLKDWSLHAVEEGDYLLAIQRAYYAIQLVEER